MTLHFGRKSWIVATIVILIFTVFVVGRNLLQAVKRRREIGVLEQERDRYQQRIDQDSTLIEHLKYDDYLEEYARENFHMQRADEHVYIVK
ncbi:MAG: septum formation initiator family protein [Alistipes sp.]